MNYRLASGYFSASGENSLCVTFEKRGPYEANNSHAEALKIVRDALETGRFFGGWSIEEPKTATSGNSIEITLSARNVGSKHPAVVLHEICKSALQGAE